MALHAKAKAEPGYRFYALYDKISREDILAHAYAQCRSNKGAPGVDRQDFEAVETYGVERWLGELALALRQETYRPDPIRRVYIPKANGKLRPLGISTLRDRVCMTAAMLVLEPIFEADLPSELYAYRPGRNAQQAVVERGNRATAEPLRHRQTKGAATDMLNLTPPRHTPTLPAPAVRCAQIAVVHRRRVEGVNSTRCSSWSVPVPKECAMSGRCGKRAQIGPRSA